MVDYERWRTAIGEKYSYIKDQSYIRLRQEWKHSAPKETLSSSISSSSRPADMYAFTGMHGILDDSSPHSISSLMFANQHPTMLAAGSAVGMLHIFDAGEPPGQVYMVEAHSSSVCDLDWSPSNEYVSTISVGDGTSKLWTISQTMNGEISVDHVRTFCHDSHASPLCIRFHPSRANVSLVGLQSGEIVEVNWSTGQKLMKKPALRLKSAITAMAVSVELGGLAKVVVGTARGTVVVASEKCWGGILTIDAESQIKREVSITSLNCRSDVPWIVARLENGNLDLLRRKLRSSRRGSRGTGLKKDQFEEMNVPIQSKVVERNLFRVVFCPLVGRVPVVVAGESDGSVRFWSLKDLGNGKTEITLVNTLSGHQSSVFSVSWNYDESLLATGDSEGTVILWRRDRRMDDRDVD